MIVMFVFLYLLCGIATVVAVLKHDNAKLDIDDTEECFAAAIALLFWFLIAGYMGLKYGGKYLAHFINHLASTNDAKKG